MVAVIPAVDVLGGRVVRLVQGDYGRVTEYADDPVTTALDWVAQGAGIVHVVDLDGARTGASDGELWRRLGGAGVRFQVGGGIRDLDAALAAIDAGARRVVMGTAAVWQPDVLAATIAAIGAERVIAALDVRAGRATGTGWLDEGRPLADVVRDIAAAGTAHILVTGIGRDGTLAGPDVDVLASVAALADAPAVIASGGVGSLDDIRTVVGLGVEGVIVGRALYDGRFTLAEAQRVAG